LTGSDALGYNDHGFGVSLRIMPAAIELICAPIAALSKRSIITVPPGVIHYSQSRA
jgi:hypothetical protein